MAFNFQKQQELSRYPILICIVGHTNHGKTSTIHTLLDKSLGKTEEVWVNGPDKTKNIIPFRVSKEGLDRAYVFDTPGFTNLDLRLAEYGTRFGRSPTIDELIESQKGMPQEADELLRRTLLQIQKSHLIIQVLDSREDPCNQTYLDEINFLKSCGVPLIVSMNFIHRTDTKREEWQKTIRSLGVSNIIQFDAHTRTWEDEQDLFKCIRPLLCDTDHKRLHQEFMDFWTELREAASDEARTGTAEDIRQLLVNVARHKTKVSFVKDGNRNEEQSEAQERFKREIMGMVNETFSKVLSRFGFSFDDVKKHQAHVDGGEGVLTMNFFDHSALKYSAAVALAAATVIIEALFGFITFGIPTIVAAVFGYFGASAWQLESEGGGTEVTFKPTNAMLMLIASAMLSLAKELKSRGRADPHLINVQLDQNVIDKKSELVIEILELNKWKHRDSEHLKKCLLEEINR